MRVASDGDPLNTVVSLVDGPPISNVRRVVYEVEKGYIPLVQLEIAMPVILIEGQVSEVTFCCPVCNLEMSHDCATVRD